MNQEDIKSMRVALDNMDDYAKMECSIDPIGAYKVLSAGIDMLESLSNQLAECQMARDEHNNFMQRNTQVVALYDSSAPSVQELIKGLRGELINCGCHASSGNECCCDCIWPEHVASKAADLIESQAAEIEKYKKLCDQMGDAIEDAESTGTPFSDQTMKALEAWGAMK